MTVTEWKAELDSKLAPGASVSDVEAHLDAKGIEHSSLIDNAELAHMGFDPATFEIKAIVRGVRQTSVVTTDIAATFVFDRDKKLLTTKVGEVHTGP